MSLDRLVSATSLVNGRPQCHDATRVQRHAMQRHFSVVRVGRGLLRLQVISPKLKIHIRVTSLTRYGLAKLKAPRSLVRRSNTDYQRPMGGPVFWTR